MRIYYCVCGTRIEIPNGKVKQCECGKVFGSMSKISDNINMRTTGI